MRLYRKFCLAFIFVILLAGIFCWQVPLAKIYGLPNEVVLYEQDVNFINKNKVFGNFVSVSLSDRHVAATTNKTPDDNQEIKFRLFNLIPIKTQKVRVLADNKIYAGGMAVGIVINSDGALIVGSSSITTPNGEYDACSSGDLQIGDIITHIEGEKVDDTSSLARIVNRDENKDKELKITAMRKNKEFTTRVKPAYDIKSKSYKLGVWVRDDASGIGTLTYITNKNRFGALGHPICDGDTRTMINVKNGSLYSCSILGVNKGVSGNPGEIKGMFMQGKNEQGYIEKNNEFGVFGDINEDSALFSCVQEMSIGGRLTVVPGKAQIRCCVDGSTIKLYDIEIIKTNYQNYSNDKSMVIRVTDKELLAKTGGIVQGMSGSPIIQNGKLVGAVTHVFVNDPTKGFGVYLDWMYKE